MNKIETYDQFQEAKKRFEILLKEATEKGVLSNPEVDNEYTQELGHLGALISDYETNALKIMPLKQKSPLIRSIEEALFKRDMKQKDAAKLLGINEPTFSQIMNGKRKLSMKLAKKLYKDLHISPEIILDFA